MNSCGHTLLDTINHILDFSKINSFERKWRSLNAYPKSSRGVSKHGDEHADAPLPPGAPPLLSIYAECDVAAIAEEIIDGVAAGQVRSNGPSF